MCRIVEILVFRVLGIELILVFLVKMENDIVV